MALVVKVYDPTYTSLLRTLTLTEDIGCHPSMRGPGSGVFALPLTAPDYAATLALEHAACVHRNIARIEDGGSAVYAGVIRKRTVVRAAPPEEAEHGIEIDTVGTRALWQRAVWYPEGGVLVDGIGLPLPYDTRHLTFVAADFDDSGWSTVTAVDISTAEQDSPTDWPDASAKKIRPGGSPTVDRDPEVFGVRTTFTTSGGDRMYRIFYTADDGLEMFIDGVRVVSEVRPRLWQKTQHIDVRLRDGTHTWAIQGTNIDFPGLNYSWVVASLWTLVQGALGIEIDTLVKNTDATWLGAQFGSTPPGFSPGAQARIFLEEAQARGALDGWTLGCTDDDDSNGNAWASEPASSYQIGLDGLSFLAKLEEAYCDVWARPDALVLDLFNKGTIDGASGVTLAPGTNVGLFVNEADG